MGDDCVKIDLFLNIARNPSYELTDAPLRVFFKLSKPCGVLILGFSSSNFALAYKNVGQN